MTHAPVPTAPDRIPARTVVLALVGIVVGIAACAIAVALVLAPSIDDRAPPPAPPSATSIPPAPFATATPVERARAARKAALDRWQWADRDRAIVRVPVEVAIDRYLRARGAP